MSGIFGNLQARLTAIVGGGILLLVVISSISVFQLKEHLEEYHQLTSVTIAQERAIKDLNFDFKVQVQEWKNVLLRGKDPEKFKKYWAEFEKLQLHIQKQGKELLADMPTGDNHKLVSDFLLAHQAAFEKYQIGVKAFEAAGFDSSAGDKAVTGIDREPTRIFAEAAENLTKQVHSLGNEINTSSKAVVFWSEIIVIASGVAVLFFVWLSLKNSFVEPLLRINTHLKALARGDFKQQLQLNRYDEMGELNDNINMVQETIVSILATLKHSSSTLQGSSAQLNQTAKDIALATQDTHSSTDQMAAALHEMSATVQEVANNASSAAEAATIADTNARQGLSVMSSTITAISQLSHEVDNVSGAMTRLEAETGRIGGVLDVIKSVAEQTNLLALNAAIEAARAGEQGRGFAVVADEVRSLAKRTQESTAEIQQIIEAVQNGATLAMQAMRNSQGKTQSTMEMANQAGAAIESITSSVARIQSMNTQIATAAEEQSYAAEEINRNVVRIVNMVENTNTQAQKSTQIAHTLDSSSRELEKQIAQFSV